MRSSSILLSSYLLFLVIFITSTMSKPTVKLPSNPFYQKYAIKFQPELDNIIIDQYINNVKLRNHQINCLVHDGPCDIVGRWVYPRIGAYLLGHGCIKCTMNQEREIGRLLKLIWQNEPEMLEKVILKYITKAGIDLPEKSRLKVKEDVLNYPGDIASSNKIWSQDIVGNEKSIKKKYKETTKLNENN